MYMCIWIFTILANASFSCFIPYEACPLSGGHRDPWGSTQGPLQRDQPSSAFQWKHVGSMAVVRRVVFISPRSIYVYVRIRLECAYLISTMRFVRVMQQLRT